MQRLPSVGARSRTHADWHQAAVGHGGWLHHKRLLFEVQRSSAGSKQFKVPATASAWLELVLPTHRRHPRLENRRPDAVAQRPN